LFSGHTHEDIDAVFAVIWRTLRHIPVLTLDDYVTECKKAFEGLDIDVKTPMVIPDYQDFLENVIDTRLGQLHKGLI